MRSWPFGDVSNPGSKAGPVTGFGLPWGGGVTLDEAASFSQRQIPERHPAVSCRQPTLKVAGRMELSSSAP